LGLGTALFQGKEWKNTSPIAYESHLMTLAKQNYPVHEQELLAVVHALQKWCMSLLGMEIHFMTDHHLLTHLLKQHNLLRQQACWKELLADFNLQFEYIKGKDNMVADALLRRDLSDKLMGANTASVACVASLTELSSNLSDSLWKQIIAGYVSDPFCTSLQQALPLLTTAP
jgi:hypothetical protein